MLNRVYFHLEQRKILYQGKEDISPEVAKVMFSKLNTGYYTSQEEEFIIKLFVKKSFLNCSGQLKLATFLAFTQYRRSDSLGVRPPLYQCGLRWL